VETTTDVNNCGSCGTRCPALRMCCSGACSDTANDTMNCGACGHACTTPHCLAGTCGL
jgi:hypothetical protein